MAVPDAAVDDANVPTGYAETMDCLNRPVAIDARCRVDGAARMTALYSIGTYDWNLLRYTPQEGLSVPSINITLMQLRQAMRELRSIGYSCHYYREEDGSHYENDAQVLVERTDGRLERDILLSWDRWPWDEEPEERVRRFDANTLSPDAVTD